jgi:hypothetical protein
MCLSTGNKISRIVAGFVVLLGATATAPGQAVDKATSEPIPFADGVIDSQLRTVFVSTAKGGIQAIELLTGGVTWTNDDCLAQPWLVAGQRLIARGDRLFVLDLKNGKVLRPCDAIDFPKVDVPERCTVSFPLWEPRVSGETLEARWFAVAHIDRSKGRPFPFQAWTAFNKSAPAGALKVNLETGGVTLQRDAKPTDVTAGLIPEAAKPEQRRPAGLNEKLLPIWQQYYKDQNGRIVAVGERVIGVSMLLEKKGQEYQKKIVLNSWDLKTGAAAEPIELVKDRAQSIANIVVTEDRRHVGVVFSNSSLSIFSLTDGKLLAKEVKGVSSPEKAFVHEKRLYFSKTEAGAGKQANVILQALDLENGNLIWGRYLKPRSTTPLPP